MVFRRTEKKKKVMKDVNKCERHFQRRRPMLGHYEFSLGQAKKRHSIDTGGALACLRDKNRLNSSSTSLSLSLSLIHATFSQRLNFHPLPTTILDSMGRWGIVPT